MKRIIPFKFHPSSWGKTGKERQIAEANYSLSGIELKKALANIEQDTPEDKALAELQVEFDEGMIGQLEFDRRQASVLKQPWVEVKKMQVNEDDPKQGYMELDWNDEFVAMLTEKGYTGESDESVVNGWFNDVCRTVLLDELQDQDYGLESRDDVVVINNNNDEEDDA
tara:strand:- start:2688 stop:3191 length:504 start_codon:yes stop_codon:yes gene_type:complete